MNLEYKCMVYNCHKPGTIPFFMGDRGEKDRKFLYEFMWICQKHMRENFPWGPDGCSYWRLG